MEGTRGWSLKNQAREIKIHGEMVPVHAEVVSLDNLSSHADYSEILEWIGRFTHKPKKIFITHGSPGASDSLRFKIKERFGLDCYVPLDQEAIPLDF